MALPKEPRQKMINFMYLVLTAMLALNVSSEILNAFKVVDGSLMKSNDVVDGSNKNIQSTLGELLKDASNAANAAIWKPKADSAIAFAGQLSSYIDQLKDSLKKESGYNPAKGDTTFKEDDLDAATRLFDTHGQGEKLKAALAKFKIDVVSVLPAKERAQIEASIPIDLNPPKSHNEASNKDWTTAYFHMTPTVAALTMLSKFQNDVKRSGNLVANKCLEQVGKVVFHLDKFQAFAGQSSEYLLPGQPLTITAGLGAFSSENKPTVVINGAAQALNADGVATYSTTAEGGGEHSVNVVISYLNPNTNKQESTTKTIKYTVGVASGASIFLEKMNVMYIGVENPLTVSAGSIKRESMNVSIGGGGSLTSAGGDRYIGKVTTPGTTNVSVTGDGKSFTFPIRVKYLPDPIALVGSFTEGPVPLNTFRAQGGVFAKLKDSDFEAQFRITSYTIAGLVNGSPFETPVSSAAWGGNAIIAALKPGSIIAFYNIMAVGPDGKPRRLNPLSFKMQ